MLKRIAKQEITINGKESPCMCDARTICAYCVQANLALMEGQNKTSVREIQGILAKIKQEGIRKTARKLGVNDNAVRYWIKRDTIPNWMVKKL